MEVRWKSVGPCEIGMKIFIVDWNVHEAAL